MAKISAARAKRLAEIYVFEQHYNQTKAYMQMQEEFNGADGVSSRTVACSNASTAFRDEKVKANIAKLEEEAQKFYDIKKEAIISQLQDIATDDETSKRDKLTALKQLTDIGGFATQKVDLNAKADIEVIIE